MIDMNPQPTAVTTDRAVTITPLEPRTPRVHVARLAEGRLKPLGAGLLVAEDLVLLPLSMSGPLRPRAGVVVLPHEAAGPEQAIAVARVVRSDIGRALGLSLQRPMAGPCVAEPETEDETEAWLDQCLAALDDATLELPGQAQEDVAFALGAIRLGAARTAARRKKSKCGIIAKLVFKTCK